MDYGDALDQHGAGQVGEADVGQYEVVGLGQQLLPLTQGIEDHQVEEDTGDIAAFRYLGASTDLDTHLRSERNMSEVTIIIPSYIPDNNYFTSFSNNTFAAWNIKCETDVKMFLPAVMFNGKKSVLLPTLRRKQNWNYIFCEYFQMIYVNIQVPL